MNKKPTFLKLAPSLPTSNSAERAATGAGSRLPLRAGLADAPDQEPLGGGPVRARLSGSRGFSPRNAAPPQAPSAAVHRAHPKPPALPQTWAVPA